VFSNPCTPVAPTTRPAQHAPASQPASSPASAPASQPDLDELLLYRLTQRGMYDHIIAESALRWGLSPWLLHSLLWHESRLRKNPGRSRAGCLGIAQFCSSGSRGLENERRARGVPLRFSTKDALTPAVAIPAAAEMLSYLRANCGTWERSIGAYGSGRCTGAVSFARRVLRYAEWIKRKQQEVFW
jgi:hypothetical protein